MLAIKVSWVSNLHMPTLRLPPNCTWGILSQKHFIFLLATTELLEVMGNNRRIRQGKLIWGLLFWDLLYSRESQWRLDRYSFWQGVNTIDSVSIPFGKKTEYGYLIQLTVWPLPLGRRQNIYRAVIYLPAERSAYGNFQCFPTYHSSLENRNLPFTEEPLLLVPAPGESFFQLSTK